MTERLRVSSLELVADDLKGLRIFRGLDDDTKTQLVTKSRQKHIREWTPKDSLSRFSNIESLEDWLSQNREVYSLMRDDKLGGIIWYGEKGFPLDVEAPNLPHHTFAVRLYRGFTGKGLAKPFMDRSLKDYIATLELQGQLEAFRGLWLSTSTANQARDLYKGYGYQEEGYKDSEVIMVLSVNSVLNRIQPPSTEAG